MALTRWKFRKLASASPIGIFEDESYGIMIQAIRSKKEADRWIVVEMGKPLLSEAVGLVLSFAKHATKLKKINFQPWASPTKQRFDFIDEDEGGVRAQHKVRSTTAHRLTLTDCSACS